MTRKRVRRKPDEQPRTAHRMRRTREPYAERTARKYSPAEAETAAAFPRWTDAQVRAYVQRTARTAPGGRG